MNPDLIVAASIVRSDVAEEWAPVLRRAMTGQQDFSPAAWSALEAMEELVAARRRVRAVDARVDRPSPDRLTPSTLNDVTEVDTRTAAARLGCSRQNVWKRRHVLGARQDDAGRWWYPVDAREG